MEEESIYTTITYLLSGE